VTAETGARGNGTVVEYRRLPVKRIVAGLAVVAAGNMPGRLASGLPAIVTAHATARNRIVTHANKRRPLLR